MTEVDQLVAWTVFVGLIVLARLLITRPVLRVLAPPARRLREWAVDRMERPEEVDPEAEELRNFLRRQRLTAHLARVVKIMLDDEWMSATRQVGNRLAYASLVAEIAELPEVYATPTSLPAPGLVDYDHRRGTSVEVLDVVGWR